MKTFLLILVLISMEARATEPQDAAARGVKWCADAKAAIRALKWKTDPCDGVTWVEGGISVQGRSIMYAEFGNPDAPNTTLIFSTVHGDEVTPFYLGVQLAQWLRKPENMSPAVRVIVAPLVNPDGFFGKRRTRTNAHGVDVNRNFATRDWAKFALVSWKKRFRSDPRRFPGKTARSEPETIFQEELIRRVKPQKILSIHAPLNFMDYDGPTVLSLARFPKQYVKECLQLRQKLKATSSGFYPGSLGNYAGRELGIPTLTLELPSADPKRAPQYWKKFSLGIKTMIEFSVPNYVSLHLDPSGGT